MTPPSQPKANGFRGQGLLISQEPRIWTQLLKRSTSLWLVGSLWDFPLGRGCCADEVSNYFTACVEFPAKLSVCPWRSRTMNPFSGAWLRAMQSNLGHQCISPTCQALMLWGSSLWVGVSSSVLHHTAAPPWPASRLVVMAWLLSF